MQLNLRTHQPIRIEQANGSIQKSTLGQCKRILIFTCQEIKGLFSLIRIYNFMSKVQT